MRHRGSMKQFDNNTSISSFLPTKNASEEKNYEWPKSCATGSFFSLPSQSVRLYFLGHFTAYLVKSSSDIIHQEVSRRTSALGEAILGQITTAEAIRLFPTGSEQDSKFPQLFCKMPANYCM